MCRITIDDSIDHDPRVMALKAAIGDAAAWGSLVGAYRVATAYYVPDRKPIPTKLFKLIPWSQPLIDSGIAELTEDGTGVFIIQSEEQFDWLISKHSNGKKGGRPKTEDNLIEPKETESKPNLSYGNPLTIAPASAPVIALAQIKENTNTIQAVANAPACLQEIEKNLPEEIEPGILAPKKSKFSDLTRKKMRSFIAKYVEVFQGKYPGCKAPESLKDKALIGKLGHWIEHVSEVRAISLVEVYLQISYRPFDENFHDLWQFFRHLNRIGHALDTGMDANMTDWSKVFAGAK